MKNRKKLIRLADLDVSDRVISSIEYELNQIAADIDDDKKMYRTRMRAEQKAREHRFSRQRSYRFAPYFKRPVSETVS